MTKRYVVSLLAILALVLLLARWSGFSWEGNGEGDGGIQTLLHALWLSLLLAWFLAGTWGHFSTGRWRRTLTQAAAWAGIFLAAAVIHAYRFDLGRLKDRVLADLVPGRTVASAEGVIRVPRAGDGHYYLTVRVNGTPVRFLADTGASDIVLSSADARRAGYDPALLRYDRLFQTANGLGRGAGITIERLEVGELVLTDIRASVNEAALDTSLLGMAFFNRLRGYEVAGGMLTLHWIP